MINTPHETSAQEPETEGSASDTVSDTAEVLALITSLAEVLSRTRLGDFADFREVGRGTLTVLWMDERSAALKESDQNLKAI
jgi:hypothetical protein